MFKKANYPLLLIHLVLKRCNKKTQCCEMASLNPQRN